MWFNQYGRIWDGPWFTIGATTTRRVAGMMRLDDIPAASLALEDLTHGSFVIADR